jgi:iron complex outermembrane receptor protein
LLPEKLKSWQLTFQLVNPVPGLMVELNGFFNHSDDLIYANGFLHVNSTPYSTYGLELSSSYKSKRFSANFSMEMMRSDDAEYSTTLHPHRVLYMPNFITNTVLAWEMVKNLKLHTHITTYSGQSGFIAHWNTLDDPIKEFDIAGRVIVDVGANYKIGGLELGVNIHNLFNLKYYQGGMNSNGALQQQGRWIKADVAFKF